MKTKEQIQAEINRQWNIRTEALKDSPIISDKETLIAIKAGQSIKALSWVLGMGEIK
ncbi:MAG: hypothetical protein [Caudoviricetes sp.]|nr:MAG: hypothetical protein [Caudoviricetes sp.]